MKRGETGLSLIVGIRKPVGMTSHDVVNKVRGIFGEKRVGHAGTLDPAASGVLPVCIGPATRLADYIGGSSKTYIARIAFGAETDTDDAEGEVVTTAPIPEELRDESFATTFVESLVGEHSQVPPRYSAIKVNGKRSYELARHGVVANLESRIITVHDASLLGIENTDDGHLTWTVAFQVSKGTYIRSLARDMGRMLNSAAHLDALERTRVGRISMGECVSLETLEALKTETALDPVRVLALRFAFGDDMRTRIENGSVLSAEDVRLYEALPENPYELRCACTASICESDEPPHAGELICMLVDNTLKALYSFDAEQDRWKVKCVFSKGIVRG